MVIKSFNRFNEDFNNSIFVDVIPHYGDVFTIDEFEESVEDGDITKMDGTGYYSDGLYMSRKHPVFYSEKPNDAEYVIWFSK